MSVATDEMYNAESRFIHCKYVIHFSSSKTLDVTKADYLVSSTNYEEAYKLTDSPFGEISSNELSLSLFSEDGIFNPENINGPYHGLIKTGIKIESFIRPDEAEEWDPFGVFYVSDWTTDSNNLSVEVVANDILYKVINGAIPSLPVLRNVKASKFLTDYFGFFGLEVKFDHFIDITLPYIYTSGYASNKTFLTDFLKAIMADCFCDHEGNIVITSKIGDRALRSTLKDSDQIINIKIKKSLNNAYDSAVVTLNKCQESAEQSLLEVTNLSLKTGMNTSDVLNMSNGPALSIKSLRTQGTKASTISSFTATASDIACVIQSTADMETNLEVIGTVLETVSTVLGELKDAPLKIESSFIQTDKQAKEILTYTKDYVDANMPTLELVIRGNPRLQLGELIEIDSEHYRVHFKGILVKCNYEYQGNLSCNITLAEATNIKEV